MPKLLQVTLGSGANTQVSATSIPVRQVTFQNNAGHSCRLGDSTTSSTKGILIAPGTPGGAASAGNLQAYNEDLMFWYIAGTAADVIDVLYTQ